MLCVYTTLMYSLLINSLKHLKNASMSRKRRPRPWQNKYELEEQYLDHGRYDDYGK